MKETIYIIDAYDAAARYELPALTDSRVKRVAEGKYGAIYVTLHDDLSAKAVLSLFCELVADRPHEVTMVGDYTIRLWWD